MRQHIRECFSSVNCFLMPHPGIHVMTNRDFDGRVSAIEPEFVKQLRDLVPLILSPPKLQLKHINGQRITGRELMEYFKSYVEIYKGDSLPRPVSVFEATAKTNNLNAIMASQEYYTREMNQVRDCCSVWL